MARYFSKGISKLKVLGRSSSTLLNPFLKSTAVVPIYISNWKCVWVSVVPHLHWRLEN